MSSFSLWCLATALPWWHCHCSIFLLGCSSLLPWGCVGVGESFTVIFAYSLISWLRQIQRRKFCLHFFSPCCLQVNKTPSTICILIIAHVYHVQAYFCALWSQAGASKRTELCTKLIKMQVWGILRPYSEVFTYILKGNMSDWTFVVDIFSWGLYSFSSLSFSFWF